MADRKQVIRLSLSKAEKAALIEAAEAKGLPVAVWTRMVALGAAKQDQAA